MNISVNVDVISGQQCANEEGFCQFLESLESHWNGWFCNLFKLNIVRENISCEPCLKLKDEEMQKISDYNKSFHDSMLSND